MGIYLREIRKEKGLTQTELAKLSGVSRVTINRLEKGTLKETTIGTLTKIAACLDVNLDTLVN